MQIGETRQFLALVGAFAFFNLPCANAETWTLDKDHTEVRFTWDHLGMSRQGGRFRDVTGKIEFDPDKMDASAVEVSIPLAGISTGVAKLDEHLVKSKDFFDVAQYPAITFKSTAVKQKSDRTFDVVGDLTINGVTKPVILDAVWNFTGPHPMASINPTFANHIASGFSASTQILRSDWGIKRTIPYISDEIRIAIETEMFRLAPVDAPPFPAATSSSEPASAPAEPATGTAKSSSGGPAAGEKPAVPSDGAGSADPAQGLPDEKVDKAP